MSYYDANTKEPDALRPHPAAKKILKLHKGDMVKLHHENRDWVARVVSISPENKQMWLAEHFEGGNLDRRYRVKKEFKYIFLRFSKIGEKQVRKVHVDPIGRVWDTGPVL